MGIDAWLRNEIVALLVYSVLAIFPNAVLFMPAEDYHYVRRSLYIIASMLVYPGYAFVIFLITYPWFPFVAF